MKFGDELDVDLIAMATHGRKGLAHAFAAALLNRRPASLPAPFW